VELRRVFSIAAAGEGVEPFERIVLTFGSERVALRWFPDTGGGMWVDTIEKDAICMAGNFGMGSAGNGFEGRDWDYLKFPEPGASRSFGWTPEKIRSANQAWQAGLRLQEKIICTFYANNAADLFELGIVWYGFADGENISPLITPEDSGDARNVGTPVTSLVTQRRFIGDWEDCPIYPGEEPPPILAPHPYVRSVKASGSPLSNAYIHRLNVRYRWVGTP
jgi:hypothetical protein